MPNLAADPNVRIISVSEKIDGGPTLRFERLDDDGTGFTYDTGTVVWVTMKGRTWFKGQVVRVRLNQSGKRTVYDVRSVIDLIKNQNVTWVNPRVNTPDPLVPEGEAFTPTLYDKSVSAIVGSEDFSTYFTAVTVSADGPAGAIKDTKGLSPIDYLKKLTALLDNATYKYTITPGPALFPAGSLEIFDNSVIPASTNTITKDDLVDYDIVKDASKTGSLTMRAKGDYTYFKASAAAVSIGGATVDFGTYTYPYARGPFQKPVVQSVVLTLPDPVGDPQIPDNRIPLTEEPPVPFVIERLVGLGLGGQKDWQTVGSPKYVEGEERVLMGQFNDLFKIQGIIPLQVTFRTRYTTWQPLEAAAAAGAGALQQDLVFDFPQLLKYQAAWVNTTQAGWDQLVAAYTALYTVPHWSGTIDVSMENPDVGLGECLEWATAFTLGSAVKFDDSPGGSLCLPQIGDLMISQITITDFKKGIVRLSVGPFQPRQSAFNPPTYPSRQKGEEAPQLGGGGGGGGGEGAPEEGEKKKPLDPKDGDEIGGPGGEGGAAVAVADKAGKLKNTKTDGSESTYTDYDTIKVVDPNATGTEITLCDENGSTFTITVYTQDDFVDYEVVDAVNIGQITRDDS